MESCHFLGWDNEEDYVRVLKRFVRLDDTQKTPRQASTILMALSHRVSEMPEDLGLLMDGIYGECD